MWGSHFWLRTRFPAGPVGVKPACRLLNFPLLLDELRRN
jgi:hypothetical protein